MREDYRMYIDGLEQAMNYIEEKSKLGSVPGLDNIIELLNRLGNPEQHIRCMHIAGTNGKGSIFSYVQTALCEAGYKVGRYVSPTIFDYLERFQLSNAGQSYNMPEQTFVDILNEVAGKVSDMEKEGLSSPTAFEIETAVAYMYFEREAVDIALIECGMGGRLDATNVFASNLMSVLASISFDHMQFLGETIPEIAYEKCGIIKENSICISAPQPDDAMSVIEACCREKNTELIVVDEADIELLGMDELGSDFIYKDKRYHLALPGECQLINASVAIEVLDKLKKTGERPIDIEGALAHTSWPGRFTVISKKPLMIVDGAHNEAAWKYLADTLNKHFTKKQFVFIIGVLRDKEYDKMVEILSPLMKRAITITPESPRALDKETLRQLILDKGVECITADDADAACREAIAWTGHSDDRAVMICGSLSFLRSYLEYFKI